MNYFKEKTCSYIVVPTKSYFSDVTFFLALLVFNNLTTGHRKNLPGIYLVLPQVLLQIFNLISDLKTHKWRRVLNSVFKIFPFLMWYSSVLFNIEKTVLQYYITYINAKFKDFCLIQWLETSRVFTMLWIY